MWSMAIMLGFSVALLQTRSGSQQILCFVFDVSFKCCEDGGIEPTNSLFSFDLEEPDFPGRPEGSEAVKPSKTFRSPI